MRAGPRGRRRRRPVSSADHGAGGPSTAARATTACSAAAGTDEFNGGAGNDNIVARDGRSELVDCGNDLDTAITDDADARIGCERIEGDADLDGVRRPADCNDANPAIRPGATDVPDNGSDENCDGADATNLDRDRDGVAAPAGL